MLPQRRPLAAREARARAGARWRHAPWPPLPPRSRSVKLDSHPGSDLAFDVRRKRLRLTSSGRTGKVHAVRPGSHEQPPTPVMWVDADVYSGLEVQSDGVVVRSERKRQTAAVVISDRTSDVVPNSVNGDARTDENLDATGSDKQQWRYSHTCVVDFFGQALRIRSEVAWVPRPAPPVNVYIESEVCSMANPQAGRPKDRLRSTVVVERLADGAERCARREVTGLSRPCADREAGHDSDSCQTPRSCALRRHGRLRAPTLPLGPGVPLAFVGSSPGT